MVLRTGNINFCLFCLSLVFVSFGSYPQVQSTDVVLWSNNKIGIESSGIINGPEYKVAFTAGTSHPFLDLVEADATVNFEGEHFNVPLLFDIYQNELIIKHPSVSGRTWFILLNKSNVREFKMEEKLFKPFDNQFYEVFYEDSAFSLIAARTKISRVKNGTRQYVRNDEFFIEHSGKRKRLTGARSFKFFLSRDQVKRLKRFLAKENIKVRAYKDTELYEMGQYVHELQTEAGR